MHGQRNNQRIHWLRQSPWFRYNIYVVSVKGHCRVTCRVDYGLQTLYIDSEICSKNGFRGLLPVKLLSGLPPVRQSENQEGDGISADCPVRFLETPK